jgi:hypothetical protein
MTLRIPAKQRKAYSMVPTRFFAMLKLYSLCILMCACSSKGFHNISQELDEFEPIVVSGGRVSLLPVVDNRSNPMVVSGVIADHFDRDVVQMEIDSEDSLAEDIIRQEVISSLEEEGFDASLVDNRNLMLDENYSEYVLELQIKDLRFRCESIHLWLFEVVMEANVYKEGKKKFSFMICGQGKEFEKNPILLGVSSSGMPKLGTFRYHTEKGYKSEEPESIAYSEALQDAAHRVSYRFAYELKARGLTGEPAP